MWSKNKKLLVLLCCGCVLLLLGGFFLVTDLLIPYRNAKNTMDPAGILTVLTGNDGAMELQWQPGENAEGYAVELLDDTGAALHEQFVQNCSAALPQLPVAQDVTVRISSYCSYGKHIRKGDEALVATVSLPVPGIGELDYTPDIEHNTVDVSFELPAGDVCSVYIACDGGEPVLLEQLHNGALQLKFGEKEAYAVPAHGQSLYVSFQTERTDENVHYYSDCGGFKLTREDFLPKTLNVECTDLGDNAYTLSWNETKGEHYEVLLSTTGGESWTTLATIPCDQERTYTTAPLAPYTDYILWVVAVGGQTLPGSEFAAMSTDIAVSTGPRVAYSTIWPLMDQKVYADPEATAELGTAAAGSAWCALGQAGKYLKIRFDGQDGYIDGDYCMINLPEYVGDLCLYNITNSYSSIYLVHEYGIRNVSGTVITGYENVKTGDDTYLVPLLFPTAQKLVNAGEAAKEQGYTLKIYDSYRPQDATYQIFMRTSAILGEYLPSQTYTGKPAKGLDQLRDDPADATTPATEGGSEGETTCETAEATTPPKTEPKRLTYKGLMTNHGEYTLSKFLAPGVSRHNFGVALDLTLVNSEGKELSMQTSMHDLSWYSALRRNNGNANILYKIMTDAGLTGISSEWWHFQDNEIYKKNWYSPLKGGVSWQCWATDGSGWRYRLADGSFYKSCTQTIDGESYTFDENGYLTHG